jgi:hypothetical protein
MSPVARFAPAFRAAAGPAPAGSVTTITSSGGSELLRIASTHRARVGGPSVAGTITPILGAAAWGAMGANDSRREPANPDEMTGVR